MNLYSDLEKEFHEPMHVVGVNFKNEYSKALDSFDGFEMTKEEKYTAIREVLQAVLEKYTKSKPKTDGGSFIRKIGRAILFMLPFLKYVKIKR